MGSGDFSREHKIQRSADFRRAFSSKRYSADKYLTVYVVSNGINQARIGLITAKRHIPKAVHRNYCKRIMRDHFRTHKHLWVGLDMVILVRHSMDIRVIKNIRKRIIKHWQIILQQSN